jgi:hypothetical protein
MSEPVYATEEKVEKLRLTVSDLETGVALVKRDVRHLREVFETKDEHDQERHDTVMGAIGSLTKTVERKEQAAEDERVSRKKIENEAKVKVTTEDKIQSRKDASEKAKFYRSVLLAFVTAMIGSGTVFWWISPDQAGIATEIVQQIQEADDDN